MHLLLKSYPSLFIIFFLFPYCQTAFAQQITDDTLIILPPDSTHYWKFESRFGLNFSQVQLENWTGGGESAISIGSLAHLSAEYTKGNAIWENKLDIAYGLLRQGEADYLGFRKTDDLLNIVTKYNYHIEENFFITAISDYRTQMDIGYELKEENGESVKIRRSDFMAPGFLISSLGATFKKPKIYSITISPFTGKFTFVMDDSLSNAGAFGIEPGDKVRSEAGAAINANYEETIFTNIKLKSNLNLFAAYDTFSHIDVNWEGTLVLKVNEYIKSTVAAQLIYDHQIIQKVQWRNVINVGFLLEI